VRERITRIDEVVDRAFDRVRGPELDGVVYRLSSAADHSLLWHFCGATRALARGGDTRWAARFAAAMAAESLLTNGVIKTSFGRVRPADYADIEWRHGLHRPITSSFPSGHATAAFCAATLLGGSPGWYTLASAVAASRVYIRLHHASDVAAGATVGLALGLAFRRFVR
jgi:membrane-associated phospholipid phosphatase